MRATYIGWRTLSIAGALGVLVGCPSGTPVGTTESLVTVHASAVPTTGGPTPTARSTPNYGPNPDPYTPTTILGAGASTDPSATGVSALAASTITLGAGLTATAAPNWSPTKHFSSPGLYAGPFTLPKSDVIIRVNYQPTVPKDTFVLYLDTADTVNKNYILQADGGFTTTFSDPISGAAAVSFYLQDHDAAATWTIDVWGPNPSPSPSASTAATPSASPSAKASTAPASTPTPKPTAKPAATPTPDDGEDDDTDPNG